MGKMLVLLVAVVTIVIGISTKDMFFSNTAMVNTSVEQYKRIQAKNIAKSGIEFAIKQLSADSLWNGVDYRGLDIGAVKIGVAKTNSRYPSAPSTGEKGYEITSIGMVDSTTAQIQAVVQFPPSLAPPPALDYALASDDDMYLSGSFMVGTEGDSSHNANIHTNKGINIDGSTLVKGYATYHTTATCKNPDKYFDPYVPLPGKDYIEFHEKVPFPEYDIDVLKTYATITLEGNQKFTAGYSLGTEENPAIVFVNGDLELAGHFSGFGYFIVSGDVSITGNTYIDAEGDNALLNKVGIYAGHNMKFTGGFTCHAQIYAENNLDFYGNAEIHGLAVAKGTIGGLGNPTIRYKPSNDNLVPPSWYVASDGEPVVVSYYE